MFGFTEAQIAGFGLTFGVGAFMLYMLFIIAQLAIESKAESSEPLCSFWVWVWVWSGLSPNT